MQKTRLFTPGPTPVFPAALEAFSKPIIHHRSADFIQVLEEVRRDLKELFGTQDEVLILAASGTGAMEGVISNLFSPKEKILFVQGGKFGERWGEIAHAFHLNAIPIDVAWGEAPTVAQIKKAVQAHPDATALFMQACETSTGSDYPIQEIAEFTRGTDLLLVVDAVSYLGVSELHMDRWGIDVVVSGSQKGLMLPPGLAFVAFNDRAWEKNKSSTQPRYYFDFLKEKKNLQKNQTAYTPAVSLIMGLREVLRYFKKNKAEIFSRYKKFSAAMRSAVQALDLELFAKVPSNGLVSICVPTHLDGKAIVKALRDEHHMMIVGGQGDYASKMIRISCIGHTDAFDLIAVFSALEEVLKAQGAKIEFGKGVATLESKLLGK